MQWKRISDGIEAAIGDPGLQDAAIELSEVVLDATFEDGLLRDIPVLGSIMGVTRTAVAIQDRLFLKKLCAFLFEPGKVPTESRAKAIRHLQESRQHQIAVGEKLLYIIDRCQDHQAANNIGRLFRAFLEGEINYDEFVRLAVAIDRLIAKDLDAFLLKEWRWVPIWEASFLIGTGLVEFDESGISVRDQDDWKAHGKYVVEGQNQTVSLSKLGAKLRSIFRAESIQTGRHGEQSPEPA